MKAIVLQKPRTLVLTDIPEYSLTEEDHVLIKVEACGICGSDLRYWAGENPWALHTLGKHIDNPPNLVMGHEFAGEVVKVNAKKHEHLLGKRVGVQAFKVCGECRFCNSGRENLCNKMIHMGHAQGWEEMDFYPGAYSEYCLGWAELLFPIPDHVSYAEAAMADILCVAVHVVDRTKIYEGANVLCFGGGPAGLSIALVAKTKGAKNIFISDPSPLAREVIAKYKDFILIDPNSESVQEVLSKHVGNEKCIAIFDSVGSREQIDIGLPLLEEQGTYVNMAVHDVSLEINPQLLGSERTITTSSNAFYKDVREAYRLIESGEINVKPWITHQLPLEEYEKAFELLLREPKAAYKVVFEPWKSNDQN